MSKKRDYTRFSKEPVETVEPIETVVEDIQPVETVEIVAEGVQSVEVEQESKIEEPKPITGVVTDCLKLNVRERPYPTAAILGVITASTELMINEEESTADFYKICTSAGLEGYCMKKFVTIMP